MRQRSSISNSNNCQSYCLERPDCSLTTRSWSFYLHFNFFNTKCLCLSCNSISTFLGCLGSTLFCPFESNSSGRGPAENITLKVADRNDGIVKRSKNVGNTDLFSPGSLFPFRCPSCFCCLASFLHFFFVAALRPLDTATAAFFLPFRDLAFVRVR